MLNFGQLVNERYRSLQSGNRCDRESGDRRRGRRAGLDGQNGWTNLPRRLLPLRDHHSRRAKRDLDDGRSYDGTAHGHFAAASARRSGIHPAAAAGRQAAATFIDQFSLWDQIIFDLLADEVLAQQPPDLRDFLLQTSILTLLTPALCTAVTGSPHAPRLLEEAYRRNLFLTTVEESNSVDSSYRYHDLFAAFLQRRLAQSSPDVLPELHRRANGSGVA